MKKSTKWALLGLIPIAVISFICFKSLLSIRIFAHGIKLDVQGYGLSDSYRELAGTNRVNWMVADSGGNKLLLGYVKPEDPEKYINDKVYSLVALYEPTTSPYPEVITNVIECPSELKPQLIESEKGKIYSVFAGERFNYGICVPDLVKYYSYYGLFDCGRKGVFEVKIFGEEKKSIEKTMKSFSCD